MIIKRKHSGSFAVIPNSVGNDDQLNADALGVLVYLLTKPQDWKVSVADIRRRFGIGRDRVYAIMVELETAGYVKRDQSRATGSRFSNIEYHVFDCPQKATASAGVENEPPPESPLPENQETEIPEEITASCFTVSGTSASGKSGRILKKYLTKPSSKGNSASNEAGAVAPSVSSKVWKEGCELLQNHISKPNRSIIGKWLKRTVSEEDKKKLLQIIRSAVRAGTGDPVAYIAKALDQEFPPAPDPSHFDTTTWLRNVQAAIKTKSWASVWGPAPGNRGCILPKELVSSQLLDALTSRKVAA
jgi:hypothetical protein